jgi:hypothetical protein
VGSNEFDHYGLTATMCGAGQGQPSQSGNALLRGRKHLFFSTFVLSQRTFSFICGVNTGINTPVHITNGLRYKIPRFTTTIGGGSRRREQFTTSLQPVTLLLDGQCIRDASTPTPLYRVSRSVTTLRRLPEELINYLRAHRLRRPCTRKGRGVGNLLA